MSTISCYRGRYHRICGKFINRTGKVTQKKFLLCTDEAKARRIADRIELLWQEVVEMRHRHIQGPRDTASPSTATLTGSPASGVCMIAP
jgi:hypothetical protein